jgi:NodT family efflux transporter outer membrane factor (OMF) lipoprotein
MNLMTAIRRALAASMSVTMLASCMVGPDFRRPDAPITPRYTETPVPNETVSSPVIIGEAQRLLPGAEIPAQWWALYRSEPLDRLIRQAIADSPNLAAAEATLREARENLIASTGTLLYPQVDANLSATREKVSAAQLFGGTGGQTNIFNLYNASVNVSYMLDVFGGNRREIEGVQALVDFQSFQLEGAYLALTSNIVTTAVKEAQLRAQISATRDIIAAEEKQLDLTQRQYQLGAVARLSVLALKTELEQTRATLPPLERDLARTRHQLAVLAGRLPSEAALPVFELETLTLPQELPVSVPSELVRQRPDIRASEALLHQASAQIGVATANLYPKITLSGAFGSDTNQFHNIFAGPSVWSIGAALLQPLFHGGALEAQRRSAIAAYDAANAQYRDTVLQGFANVADVLRALETDARALSAQAEAESAARQTLDLTTRQFQLGGASYLALLIAQRQYQQARIALALAQATRLADTAALFQALGGGWWNREGTAAATN